MSAHSGAQPSLPNALYFEFTGPRAKAPDAKGVLDWTKPAQGAPSAGAAPATTHALGHAIEAPAIPGQVTDNGAAASPEAPVDPWLAGFRGVAWVLIVLSLGGLWTLSLGMIAGIL